MYVINRLEKMVLEEENDIRRILATYFLTNINTSLTLQKTIKDTGVSKSTIYTFFSEAGFKSFRSFTRTINDEYLLLEYSHQNDMDYKKDLQFDKIHINNLVGDINHANNIYFYGNQKEINLFQEMTLFLIQKGLHVKNLNLWNISIANKMLDNLKDNDILIIIDTGYRLNNYYDMGAVSPNMIDLDKVNQGYYNKYYIGKRNIEENNTQLGFEIIYMDKKLENISSIGLLLLDKYITSILRKKVTK